MRWRGRRVDVPPVVEVVVERADEGAGEGRVGWMKPPGSWGDSISFASDLSLLSGGGIPRVCIGRNERLTDMCGYTNEIERRLRIQNRNRTYINKQSVKRLP